MNFTALLLFLGLMRTACSKPVCPSDCEHTHNYDKQDFIHVSELQHSSVAPWKLSSNISESREPSVLRYAVCKTCTVSDMIAKAIYLRISVYERVRTDKNETFCKCPFELAVGCTCVKETSTGMTT